MTYTDQEGKNQTPLCIHRAPLSTHERFIGFLIEHYGGDFPLWLSPNQVTILPVSEKTHDYAQTIKSKLKNAGIRVNLDNRPDKIGAKIRLSELNKVPIMLIVGEKEEDNSTVTVRRRFVKDQETTDLDSLISGLNSEINKRSLPYRESK